MAWISVKKIDLYLLWSLLGLLRETQISLFILSTRSKMLQLVCHVAVVMIALLVIQDWCYIANIP